MIDVLARPGAATDDIQVQRRDHRHLPTVDSIDKFRSALALNGGCTLNGSRTAGQRHLESRVTLAKSITHAEQQFALKNRDKILLR
jgi:hypothetical protein